MFFRNEKIELEHVMEGLDRKILAADGTMMLVEMQFAQEQLHLFTTILMSRLHM